MTIETGRFTVEIRRTHVYLRGFGWEALWDLSGTVGSSCNRC
jgi:hypothetical protein